MSLNEQDDVLSVLGIDLEELEWQDLALCRDLETNLFYDDYESDESVAKTVDQACFSCPVQAQCLEWAVRNNEWGVWGGIYLTAGKPDKNRNSHKTKHDWDAIKEVIGGNAL
jgi:hypothetical protein